jgi:hypothetical protein
MATHTISPEWNPDCLDRFLGWWKGSPKTIAATGYYMLRILYSVLVVYGTIVFAGVIVVAATRVTNCDSGEDGGTKCNANVNDDTSTGCTRLWGIIKVETLLPVISTIAAIIVALTSSLVGSAMDVTSWRRQFGLAAYVLAFIGMVLCLAIAKPTEGSIIVCSIGLILIIICKAFVIVQSDSYGPELSPVQAEVGTAISGAFCWSLIANVLLVILWSLIGMGMSNTQFGLAVTIGSLVLLVLAAYPTYRRLPDVPAANTLPEGMNLASYTARRFLKLLWETYHDYPDLGLIIFSGMLFDPALTAILAAAVSIMITKYKFSASQVTIILGLSIVAAIPAVPLSRWVPSTPWLTWLFNDAHDPSATALPKGVDAELELTSAIKFTAAPVVPVVANDSVNTTAVVAVAPADAGVLGSAQVTVREVSRGGNDSTEVKKHAPAAVFHPHRVRAALIFGLVLAIINTILVVQVLTPCNFGLACLFSALWGFILSFCWNSHAMLRISVTPGGRESEFAGLYMMVFSAMIWLPLFVFSVATEVWSIGGALYILTIFMGLGGIVLFFVQLNRGLEARQRTLGMRRWAHVIVAGAVTATEADKMESA